jgi:hypothetical protein
MNRKLGKLKNIELRKQWEKEPNDFTKWLALKGSIELLSNEIDISINFDSIATEEAVGKFSADIFAVEEGSKRKIIIENQLERTDHDHLGKIITYASGLDAEIIIWIAKDIRDEHKQAIDWLNEHTDEEVNIFAIKMELWQIGDSPYAPKFHIICKPNEWTKALKKSVLTATNSLQLEFWSKFKEYANNKSTTLRLRKHYPQHWYSISMGHSEAHINLIIGIKDNFIRCELNIPDARENNLFNALNNYKNEIEEEYKEKIDTKFKEKLIWLPIEKSKASKINIQKSIEIKNESNWEQSFEWFIIQAEMFESIFYKYLKMAKE